MPFYAPRKAPGEAHRSARGRAPFHPSAPPGDLSHPQGHRPGQGGRPPAIEDRPCGPLLRGDRVRSVAFRRPPRPVLPAQPAPLRREGFPFALLPDLPAPRRRVPRRLRAVAQVGGVSALALGEPLLLDPRGVPLRPRYRRRLLCGALLDRADGELVAPSGVLPAHPGRDQPAPHRARLDLVGMEPAQDGRRDGGDPPGPDRPRAVRALAHVAHGELRARPLALRGRGALPDERLLPPPHRLGHPRARAGAHQRQPEPDRPGRRPARQARGGSSIPGDDADRSGGGRRERRARPPAQAGRPRGGPRPRRRAGDRDPRPLRDPATPAARARGEARRDQRGPEISGGPGGGHRPPREGLYRPAPPALRPGAGRHPPGRRAGRAGGRRGPEAEGLGTTPPGSRRARGAVAGPSGRDRSQDRRTPPARERARGRRPRRGRGAVAPPTRPLRPPPSARPG